MFHNINIILKNKYNQKVNGESNSFSKGCFVSFSERNASHASHHKNLCSHCPSRTPPCSLPMALLLFKLSLAIAFKEIATSISKKARLNDEYAFYISLYYVHYINFNRFV